MGERLGMFDQPIALIALLQALRDRTDGRVEWAVLDWNQPAIEFYRSLGAAPVEGWTTYRWPPRTAAP